MESSLCHVTLADMNSLAKKDFIIVKDQSMILNILNVLKLSSDCKILRVICLNKADIEG